MLHLINILKNMEVNMNRLFGLLFALFLFFIVKQIIYLSLWRVMEMVNI